MRDNAATVGKSFRFLPAPTCGTGNATPEDKVRGGWREECCRPGGHRCRGESTGDNGLLLCSLSIAAHSAAERESKNDTYASASGLVNMLWRAPKWQVVQEKCRHFDWQQFSTEVACKGCLLALACSYLARSHVSRASSRGG